jgi:hypothetical protein
VPEGLLCVLWIVLMVIIAGVLVWGLTQLPLDSVVVQVGRVCIIVVFVIVAILYTMHCLGVASPFGGHHTLGRP